jgi:hypothetical protein
MTRDDWYAYAESVPLTPNQRGAIMHECDRLGVADRTERLAMLAGLLGLDMLSSTADLTLSQAGQLVRILSDTRDRAELPEVATAAETGDDGQEGEQCLSVADAISRILLMVAMAAYGDSQQGESGNIAPNIRRFRARDLFSEQENANDEN